MTMPDLWSVLSAPLAELLGWVLLHFVWQGALVAAVLAGALYVLRDHAPTVRYAVSCAALVGLLALPIGTGLFLSDSMLGADSAPTASVVVPEGTANRAVLSDFSAAVTAPSNPASLQARVSAWLQPTLPWIVMGWAVGVLLFSIRLAGGARRVRRLRRASTPAPDRWRDRLRSLADQFGLHRTPALRISDHVDTPMVAGWWRPVVLVPVGLLSGLPPDQVKALLLHELAHVRRHDVLVGRLQAVVETLLFFHPATWWVSRQVRQTRETCCDDLTVQAGADRTVYARALAALAERTLAAPHAAGALAASDGSLLQRIRRVLAPTNTPEKTARRLSAAIAVVLIGAILLGLAACASQQSTAEPEPPEEAPPTEQTESPPTPPRAPEPEPEPEGPTVVVVQDDSIRRVVTVQGDEAVEVDSLDDGGYVLRYEGEHVDTLDVPRPEVLIRPEPFDRELRVVLDSDSLERVIRTRVRPDSLERVLLKQVKPDSLKRALRMRIDPDRLERHARRLELRSDSLERVIVKRVNPDSLERVLRARLNPDSLERVFRRRFDPDSLERVFRKRFDPDSLERRVLRYREHADSLSRVFEKHFSDEEFAHGFAQRFSDSTFVFDPDAFDHEAFEFELNEDTTDVEILFRRHKEGDPDRLFRQHQLRADSLRLHFERMPEQLREQARRLRERAERLEERAEEMEAPSPSPDSSR